MAVLGVVILMFAGPAAAARPECKGYGLDPAASRLMAASSQANAMCQPRLSRGYAIPDPGCTPGAVNPTLTLDVLQDPRFRTGCVRDRASTLIEKQATYTHYGVLRPRRNSGRDMVCELDHVVSLELGGSDSVDNIWPQCGSASLPLQERAFHLKDVVEKYLAAEVQSGGISLDDAQRGIAADWTQYLDAAEQVKGAEYHRRRDRNAGLANAGLPTSQDPSAAF